MNIHHAYPVPVGVDVATHQPVYRSFCCCGVLGEVTLEYAVASDESRAHNAQRREDLNANA